MTAFEVPADADEHRVWSINEHNSRIAELFALPVSERVRRSTLGQRAFALESYRTVSILRLRKLTLAACSEFNGDNLMAAVVLSRSLVETAAHFVFTHQHVQRQLRKKPPDLERLYDRLMQSLFATNIDALDTQISPQNILNAVDGCDELLEKLLPEFTATHPKPIREGYDVLSDMVHPNAFAYLFHLDYEDSAEADSISFWPEGNPTGRQAVASSIFRALLILDIYLIAEKEMRDDVAKMSRSS